MKAGYTTCVVCRQVRARSRGRCSACYEYRRRVGTDRPASLYDPPDRVCVNCGRVQPVGKTLSRGRCRTCAQYMWRTGVERPRRWYETT